MVIELVRYHVPAGQENTFEETVRQAVRFLGRSSHCLGYSLQRATLERNRYVFMVYWDTPDGHLIGFRQSPDYQEFSGCLKPFADAVEEDQHYRRTGVEMSKQSLVRLSPPPRA